MSSPFQRADKKAEELRRYWNDLAPNYDREISVFEKLLFGDGRHWACSRALGDVLEVAVGTGRNLAFYPRALRITGIDLSPVMLEIARQRASKLGREVELQVGDAQALAFPDNRFDSAVCTLALCCIPDGRRAVAEMKRVLRPGGRLLVLDHVRSNVLVVQAIQRIVEPLWLRFHPDSLLRRPLEHLRAEGFEIEEQGRSKLGIVERVSARKPA